MLLAKRRLAVINPVNGLRFTISLRDWEQCVWAVRVIPQERGSGPPDAYETAHRLISREAIEDWLTRLELDRRPQRGLTVRLRDYISAGEREHRRRLEKEVAAGRLPAHVVTWGVNRARPARRVSECEAADASPRRKRRVRSPSPGTPAPVTPTPPDPRRQCA